MLVWLKDAKNYAISSIEGLTQEKMEDVEKQLVEALLENTFFDAIKDKIDEQELKQLKLTSSAEVDGYLFNKIPDFTTILEDVTTTRLSEYLSQEETTDDKHLLN